MTDATFIPAGTLLASASEPVLKDQMIRIRGDLVESVEPLPAAPPETSTGTLVIDARDNPDRDAQAEPDSARHLNIRTADTDLRPGIPADDRC